MALTIPLTPFGLLFCKDEDFENLLLVSHFCIPAKQANKAGTLTTANIFPLVRAALLEMNLQSHPALLHFGQIFARDFVVDLLYQILLKYAYNRSEKYFI